ncbi:FtsX-like permease family protein, partial [bacterium]|nr:FtsX-like permease family protein [bacterium]
RVFIPATTYQAMLGDRYLNNMVYKVKDPKKANLVEKKLDQLYGRKFHFDPNDAEALWIWDTTEMDKFVDGFSLGLRSFLGLIGAITLIVGGIGLANIMYVVVQERTHEIGIQRAVGAHRRTIMRQFMLECFLIVAMSALIGFALAFVIIELVGLLPIEEYVGTPQLSWPIVLISISILGVIGFLAGYFPSRRASRLVVVNCLRS